MNAESKFKNILVIATAALGNRTSGTDSSILKDSAVSFSQLSKKIKCSLA
jgi:hypothetical protein